MPINNIISDEWWTDKKDHLVGTKGDDALYGYRGDDYLEGGEGHDYLYGDEGNDKMLGGKGDDHYFVDSWDDEIIEKYGEGQDFIYTSVTYAMPDNVEFLIMEGYDDIDAYGNDIDNNIYGNSGDNSLWGYGGKDVLLGGGGKDDLHGGNGDDYLDGGEGADTMMGGRDNDTYVVDNAGDKIVEVAGMGIDTVEAWITHTLAANVENLTLMGNANIDAGGNELGNVLTGNNGNNMLFGYAGDDTLNGGKGADSMWGGANNDKYYVDNAGDKVFEVAGNGYDTVFSTIDYKLTANVEVLSLAGGTATKGTGNELSNTIFGNSKDNILDGGAGSDDLSGLGGNDTFVFKAGEANGDRVWEFNGNGAGVGDVLKFVGYGPGATLNSYSDGVWIVASADGSIQDVIYLDGAPNLDNSDWVFG